MHCPYSLKPIPNCLETHKTPVSPSKVFAYVEGIESRLCYFSYSPNGYVAGIYQAFALKTSVKEEEEKVSDKEIDRFISSYIFLHPLTAGQRHSNVFKLACEACRRHYSQEGILRELTTFFEHTDFSIEALKSVLSSGYKQINEQAPTSSPVTDTSLQKDKRTKTPYGTMENATSDDETYWLGEEFRKETPLFSRDLYNNLPNPSDNCTIE